MVGKKIRAYREFRGYSQIQLAELSGINVGTIRKYELGIRNPKPDQLEKIATALGLNVSVFLDFNIETVGDVLSLLFSIDDSVNLSLAETPDQKVSLTFDNPTMQDFFRKWCQFKNVYEKEKAEILAIEDENKRNFSLIQFNDGTALNDKYTLRTFPIWDSNLFHGGTSCHLSTSWALAEASRLRHDKNGMQLVGKQLEWTFGHNPFNQTLMYGVGYNFAPQFAYCTKNVVGSLAVGMDCIRGDKPHWNGSTYATCKEMWIAPVNRFMGTVAAFNENIDSLKQKHNIQISIEKEDMSASSQKAVIRLIGEGTHQLAMHLQNATTDFQPQKVALVKGEEKKIEVTFNIQDTNKPFVAAIIADANVQLINDVSGAYY